MLLLLIIPLSDIKPVQNLEPTGVYFNMPPSWNITLVPLRPNSVSVVLSRRTQWPSLKMRACYDVAFGRTPKNRNPPLPLCLQKERVTSCCGQRAVCVSQDVTCPWMYEKITCTLTLRISGCSLKHSLIFCTQLMKSFTEYLKYLWCTVLLRTLHQLTSCL